MTATYVGHDGLCLGVEEFVAQIASAGLVSYCASVRFCRRIDPSVRYLPKTFTNEHSILSTLVDSNSSSRLKFHTFLKPLDSKCVRTRRV